MTITKDKRTGYYKARVRTLFGKTRQVTTRATSKEEAKRILRKSHLSDIEEAAKAGRLAHEGLVQIVIGKRVTFQDAVREFERRLTNRGRSAFYVRSTVATLTAFGLHSKLTKNPITSIDEEMIDAFINAKDERGAAWRASQKSVLTRFCEFLQDKGWLLGNPAKLTSVRMDRLTHEQKEKKELRAFTDTEIAALKARCEPGSFWHAAITLSRWTGLRLGDVATLEWASLKTDGKIIVWTEKKDKRVALDIHPELEQALAAVVNTSETDGSRYVFPNEAAIANDTARRANLSTYFRRLCGAAGIKTESLSFHSLRRAYIDHCVRNKIPIEHIKLSVGHSHAAMTMHYVSKDLRNQL